MVNRAKELGRTHFAYTDHGHMSSALKAARFCKPSKDKTATEAQKKAIKFIPGIEIYFRDPKHLAGTKADRCRYFTLAIHAQDQAAFQALSKIISRENFPTIKIHEERQQVWNFANLNELTQFNVTIMIGGVHCPVGKPMLAGAQDVGVKHLEELLDMFGPDRVFGALLVEPWQKKWSNVIEVKYTDGTSDSLLTNDQVSTDKARRMKAIDLVNRSGHTQILSRTRGIAHYEVNKFIESIKLHKGFLPLPGGDAALKVNKFLKALSSKVGFTLLVTDYAYFAHREDKIVQTMRLEGNDKLHPTLNMKGEEEVRSYLANVMKMDDASILQILTNNDHWAARFDNLKLDYSWRLAEAGGDPLKLAMEIIRANGRMRWNDPKYVSRLQEELKVIAKNPKKDLTAYFLPIRDVLNKYKEEGLLTGPGRGSAGGSLFVYCLGITQIDPFDYDLPFQRFFSLDRIMGMELPDIDVDLESRELLVGEDGRSGYLYGRWGDKAAQISTRTTIRLKSAIKDVNRYFKGKVEPEIELLSQGLPAPPQGVNDHQFVFGYEDTDGNHIDGIIEQSEELKNYAETRPQEWDIVSKAMGLTRAYSTHASAFVLADCPIQDVVPTKDGHITQYEAKESEAAGLIKYDFLVINQLKDIRVCLDLINKKNGVFVKPSPDDTVGWWHPESDSGVCANCCDVKHEIGVSDGQIDEVSRKHAVPEMVCSKCKKPLSEAKKGKTVGYFDHHGKETYIWALPAQPEVYQSVWQGQTETCFQINTRSMIPFVIDMLPQSMMDIATLLALVRPGPMDFIDPNTGRNMVEEYMLRRKGQAEPDIKELAELLPETYGIITFQEQLNKIARDLAGFPGPEAETLRKNMAKKKMVELMKIKPSFIEGATKKVSQEIAEGIWERMVTFGRYGFSIIHAVEYAHITYACMFLKYHYPLEWWAAILTNASEKEITGKFWPYVKDLVMPPDINLSGDAMAVDYANEKIRSKLGIIRGMGDKTIDPIVAGRPYKDIQDFVDRDVAGASLARKLIHVGVLDSLFPPKSTLLEKLQAYEDAVEVRKFNIKWNSMPIEKQAKAKVTAPKKGEVPEQYLNLTPLQDICMRKAVLPSLPVNLYEIGANHSKVLSSYIAVPKVMSHTGHETPLINGDRLQRLDETDGDKVLKDIYVAATCYVVEVKEFSYAKNTKRALKMILDADGYVSEKVLWPDYDSGELKYPEGLKKGSIATVFFRKKPGKKDMAVRSIVLEG